MTIKPLNSQISIFLSDGIMNPTRYTKDINNCFDGIFIKEVFTLKLDNAPSDMPLVRFSSKDGKIIYDFAMKRLNFYISFDEKDSISIFENYKAKVELLVKKILLKHSNISRIGLAINYYFDFDDKKYDFWVKKYNLPLYKPKSTMEITYTINNIFLNKGIKYNNVITLSNIKDNHNRIVPSVSVDVNNVETSILSNESIYYIFNDIDSYKIEQLENTLKGF